MKILNTFGTFCPVCGLDLGFKAWNKGMPRDDEICPCCGTQFGYHDSIWDKDPFIHKTLRQKWIDEGMKWWSKDDKYHPQPQNWDPKKQLENIPKEFR
ncbi:MAG: hypothetical protein HYS02_02130 [Candidatus Staskawiczbacteria bacterium]|nr:hypothetical protein [Candidatus Staskawiczbacteria bacterium]